MKKNRQSRREFLQKSIIAAAEKFMGNAKANKLLTRTYREPYVL